MRLSTERLMSRSSDFTFSIKQRFDWFLFRRERYCVFELLKINQIYFWYQRLFVLCFNSWKILSRSKCLLHWTTMTEASCRKLFANKKNWQKCSGRKELILLNKSIFYEKKMSLHFFSTQTSLFWSRPSQYLRTAAVSWRKDLLVWILSDWLRAAHCGHSLLLHKNYSRSSGSQITS